MTKLGAYLQTARNLWNATRADVRLTEEKFWSPSPRGLRQRVRQSVCFLTAHRMVVSMDAPVNDPDGHPHQEVTELCLRCGIRLSYCFHCAMQD